MMTEDERWRRERQEERRREEDKRLREAGAVIRAGMKAAEDYADRATNHKKREESPSTERAEKRKAPQKEKKVQPATGEDLLMAAAQICGSGGKDGKHGDKLNTLFNEVEEALERRGVSKEEIRKVASDFTDTKRLTDKDSFTITKYCVSRIDESNLPQKLKKEAREEIIADTFERCAINYSRNLGRKVGIDESAIMNDEFYNQMYVAFREHFDEYNPIVSAPTTFFKPYFTESIRVLRGGDVSKHDVDTEREIRKAEKRLKEKGVSSPSIKQLSEESGLSEEKIYSCRAANRDPTDEIRLNAETEDKYGRKTQVVETIASKESPYKDIENREVLRHALLRIMNVSGGRHVWEPILFYYGARIQEEEQFKPDRNGKRSDKYNPLTLTARYYGIPQARLKGYVDMVQTIVRSDPEGKEISEKHYTQEERDEAERKSMEERLNEFNASVQKHLPDGEDIHYTMVINGKDGKRVSASFSLKGDYQINTTGPRKGQTSLKSPGIRKERMLEKEAAEMNSGGNSAKKKSKDRER